jgi:hypothetical protein
VPFSEAYTNAEVATFQLMADGSFTFNESSPNDLFQTQAAAGTATNVNNNGSYTVTTNISLPVSGDIPIAQETTSPAPGPTNNYSVPEWYPGGAALTPPLYSVQYSEGLTTIPSQCNVPASIATQAFVVIETNSQLDVAAFRNRLQTWEDFYVPGGVGFVCEQYTDATTNYRFSNGIISSLAVNSSTIGVPNAGSLSIRRTP